MGIYGEVLSAALAAGMGEAQLRHSAREAPDRRLMGCIFMCMSICVYVYMYIHVDIHSYMNCSRYWNRVLCKDYMMGSASCLPEILAVPSSCMCMYLYVCVHAGV